MTQPDIRSVASRTELYLTAMRAIGWQTTSTAIVVQGILLTGFYWFESPFRPRVPPRLRRDVAGELLRYGQLVTGARLVELAFVVGQTFVVGYLFGAVPLGAYRLAATGTNLAPTFLSLGVLQALFPLYATVRDDRDALQRAFALSLHLVGLLMAPATLGLVLVAPKACIQLLGSEWVAAAPLLQLLAIAGLARTISAW